MSYSSRVLRACALLALPTGVFAQATKGPTIFSPAAQVGTVNLRAAIVLQDYTVKPLPLLKVVAMRNERPDSVSAQTDLDGRAALTLNVGVYTVRARTPQPVAGRMYEWAVKVVVRPQQSQSVDLTNSNAFRSDSVVTTPAVVAEAKPAPQSPSAAAPQPTAVQQQTAQAKAAPAKTSQAQPAQTKPVTPKTTAPQTVASQPAPSPATPPKASPSPKAETATSTPSKSAPAPTPVNAAPPSTDEKAVAKSEPPKPAPAPAPTPAPAPAKPSSTPATTAQATPFAPAPSASKPAAPVAKRADAAPRPRRTNTSGLMVGLSFDAASIRSDDLNSRTESGPGIAGMIGWGITKNIALALDASGAQISSVDGNYNLGHADIGARWHFVNRTAFVPFVDVGYAGRALMKRNVTLTDALGNTSTGTLTYMGTGVSYGGGLEYFITPGIAFGGAFRWTTGSFSQVRFENLTVEDLKLSASSARFNMGFTWYPMGH